MRTDDDPIRLDAATYRRIDQVTKALGVTLVAVGLAVGGHTAPGVAFGVAGAAIGLLTVFMEHDQ
jgi:multisubunit Na+/H+ antiporter MnhB subunit